MNKPIALLLVVLAVVAAVALWQPWTGAPPPPPSVEGLDEPGGAPGVARAHGPGSGAGPNPAERSDVGGEADAEPGAQAGLGGVALRVRDALGRPVADVPVAVVTGRTSRLHVAWLGRTDANGEARAHPVLAPSDQPPAVAEAIVTAPIGELVAVEFPLADPPVGSVELVLPPVGAVDVVLEHPDARRLEGATVRLRDLDSAAGPMRWLVPERAVENGRASFEHVGLGLRLRVSVALGGGNISAEVDVDGPVGPDERTVVHLPVVVGKTILVAELRDERGELLRGASLDAVMKARMDGSTSSSSFETDSDEDGRLHLELDDDLGTDAERSLQLSTGDDPTRAVFVELPRLHAGENDLGMLTLRPPPLVCSGRVVDPAGVAVADASIQVRRKQVYDASRPDGFYWDYVDVPETRTDSDGAFALHGVLGAGEHGLSISASGFRPLEPQSIAVGSAGLSFVLDRAGTLRGRVLFGDLYRRGRFTAEVVRGKDVEREDVGADGSFSFDQLASGDVTARVRVYGDPNPVFERALRIEPGTETVLEDIDLRGTLREIGFRVVDRSDRPVPDASAVLMHDGARSTRYEGMYLDAGRGATVARGDSVDVLAYAHGFKSVRVRAVRDGDRIVLGPACEVHVRLSPRVAPPAGTVLEVGLQPLENPFGRDTEFLIRSETRTSSMSGGGVPWAGDTMTELDASGAATLSVAEAGRFRVRVRLRRAGGGGRAISVGYEPELVVGEADVWRVVEVVVTAQEIAEARAALSQ